MTISQNVIEVIVMHQRSPEQANAIARLVRSLPESVSVTVEKGRFGDYENIQHTGIVVRLGDDSWCITSTRDDKMWWGVNGEDARIVRYLKRGISIPNAKRAACPYLTYDILDCWRQDRETIAENLPRLRAMTKLQLFWEACAFRDEDGYPDDFNHLTRPNLPSIHQEN